MKNTDEIYFDCQDEISGQQQVTFQDLNLTQVSFEAELEILKKAKILISDGLTSSQIIAELMFYKNENFNAIEHLTLTLKSESQYMRSFKYLDLSNVKSAKFQVKKLEDVTEFKDLFEALGRNLLSMSLIGVENMENLDVICQCLCAYCPLIKSFKLGFHKNVLNGTHIFERMKVFTQLQALNLSVETCDMSWLQSLPQLISLKIKYQELIVGQNFEIIKILKVLKLAKIKKNERSFYYMRALTRIPKNLEPLIFINLASIRKLIVKKIHSIEGLFKSSSYKRLQYLKICNLEIFNAELFTHFSKAKRLKILELEFPNKHAVLDLGSLQIFTENYSIQEITIKKTSKLYEKTSNNISFYFCIGEFLSSLKNLKKLHISDKFLPDQVQQCLFTEILRPENLQSLTINLPEINLKLLGLSLNNQQVPLVELNLQIVLQHNLMKDLITLISQNTKLQSLKVDSYPTFKMSQDLENFFVAVQKHQNLRNIALGIDIKGRVSTEEILNFLSDLETIAIKTCKNLRELQLPIRKAFIQPGEDDTEIMKANQAFINNLVKNLPLIDIIVI